jgi:hypothetical protein
VRARTRLGGDFLFEAEVLFDLGDPGQGMIDLFREARLACA